MYNFNFESFDFKRNLLFSGPTGVGKTFRAKEILSKFSDPNKHEKLQTYNISDAKFKQLIKSNQLILRKPDEYTNSIESYPLEMMLRVGVLMYDDIGVSDVSDAYLRDLTFILDERIEKNLINIFTTNLKSQELKERLNERILSRILLNTDVVVFTGKDRRLQNTNYFSV